MAEDNKDTAPDTPGIVYCRCAYAGALPKAVKDGVLKNLCESGIPFQAVSDLCEMSARQDPRLAEIAGQAGKGGIKIAACYPRAVRWLFHAAGSPLPKGDDEGAAGQVEIVNLRDHSIEECTEALVGGEKEEPSG